VKEKTIDPKVHIGHVHLKVANLQRALDFYCGVLGFELPQRYGEEAAFVSAGGYHHHIGLNTWESRDGSPPPKGTTGLYHFAILYPTRAALADALRRLIQANISLEGASDHGVSEALYLLIRMETELSFTGTDQKNYGRATKTDRLRCPRDGSSSAFARRIVAAAVLTAVHRVFAARDGDGYIIGCGRLRSGRRRWYYFCRARPLSSSPE
jgi:catechol 2,3-dioxygenase